MDFFDYSWSTLLLLLILVPAGFLYRHWFWKKRFRTWGDFSAWQATLRYSRAFALLRMTALLLALAFMVFALMRPRWGAKFTFEKESGVDMALVLDISPSMNAEDVPPSRLKRVKDEMAALLDQLQGNRVGLVLFSGAAFIQCPLTGDLAALRLFLDKAESDMINLKGTNIEEGLKKALALLSSPFKRNRVILLITDGEDHEGDAPQQAAAIYKQHKIQIHTIGIGTASGARVPEDRDLGDTLDTYLFKKDKGGQYVTSKLNAAGLKKIAAAGGGEYYFLSGSAFNSQALADRIRNMEKSLLKDRRQMQLVERYPLFLGAGLFFLLVFLLTSDRRRRHA